MPKWLGKVLGIGAGTILLLGASGYWYVFIAGAPQLDPPKVVADADLNFELKTYKSAAMNSERTYGLILLHGGHGDARAYQDKAAVTSVLHDLYKSKRLPPSIVITPDGNDKRGTSPLWDPQYFDGPNGKVGSAIGSELVSIVKSRYRTLEDPKSWAMGGQSSGGWGAFNIGL